MAGVNVPTRAEQWSGSRVTKIRAQMEPGLPAPCGKCGREVSPGEKWAVGHKVDRWERPDLMFEPWNWQYEHKACSDRSGQAAVIAKAKAEALAEAGLLGSGPLRQSPTLPAHTHGVPGDSAGAARGALELRRDLTWNLGSLGRFGWLEGLLDVPEDASPPLAMTPPHPEATGSYGPEAVEWMESNLTDLRGKPLRLRWWQKLAVVRQLEHRADGSLCWRTVIESCPRRAGKSVRLRAVALWRLGRADLFDEPQLVMHTGKDVGIVREIHRQAWRWAMEREGWDVRRGAGQEEVSSEEGANRWLVKAMDGVYGFDVCLGLVDESWAVPDAVIEEGLEPAMMGRVSPQLLLTTTSHRRATGLMRRRISNCLSHDDGETLLLWWGSLPQDDPADEATWRAASPHWDEDRRKVIAGKWLAAQEGKLDREADEVDPMAAFLNQYLNQWTLKAVRREEKGERLVPDELWSRLEGAVPAGPPDAVAVEAWPGFTGAAVCRAWSRGGEVTVSVEEHPSLRAAAEAVRLAGCASPALVGKSLAQDPAFAGLPVEAATGYTRAVALDLARMAADGSLRHDGGEFLGGQVEGLRVSPSPDGPRLVSSKRADAVKAAGWAAQAAREPRGVAMIW